MSVFEKLQFWKKKDDFDLGGDLGKGLGSDFSKEMPLGGEFSPSSQGFGDAWSPQGAEQQPSFGQNPQSTQPFDQQSASPSFGQPSYPPKQQPFSQQQQSFGQQPSFSSQSFSQPAYSAPSYAPPQQNGADYINSKSLEVISSKIDALRAAIESMNARLANIERIAGQEEDNRRRRYY